MKTVAIPRASYFVSTRGQPRVRRPRDILMTVVGLVLALWAMATVNHVASWDSSFTQLVQSGPGWVRTLLSFGYLLSLLYALTIIGALIAGGKDRRDALRDIAIVAIGTTGLVILLSRLVNGTWPYFVPEIGLDNPVAQFPVTRVAVVTAILVCATPFVTRPLRFLGWFAVFVTSIAAVGLEYGTLRHTFGSLGVGLFSAGLLLLIVGSPKGYPDPESVAAGLRLLGAENSGIALADHQMWGALRFTANGEGGRPLDIKVLGRDASDSQRAAKLWRTLWYREMSRTANHSRLQTVEHEALITMMARRAGVRVPELVAVGNPTSEMALIALELGGQTLDDVDSSLLTDQFLVDVWSGVKLMHDRSISHGRLNTGAIRVEPDGYQIADFAYGSLAPDDANQCQ